MVLRLTKSDEDTLSENRLAGGSACPTLDREWGRRFRLPTERQELINWPGVFNRAGAFLVPAKLWKCSRVQRMIVFKGGREIHMESIRELLIEEMADLYDAEKQLVKALPKMAKAASNEQLREAFENHLEQTRGHVERLEQAFQLLDHKAKGKPCRAMKGLIEEGKETLGGWPLRRTAGLGYHLRRSKSGALRDRRLRNSERLGPFAWAWMKWRDCWKKRCGRKRGGRETDSSGRRCPG